MKGLRFICYKVFELFQSKYEKSQNFDWNLTFLLIKSTILHKFIIQAFDELLAIIILTTLVCF